MSRLTLSLLGTPCLAGDSVPIHLRSRTAMALLAYLAVSGKSHSRATLAALFWPESDARRARGALRSTLWLLNKALDRALLVVDREAIGLESGHEIAVDVVRFRCLLARCRAHSHPAGVACARRLALLAEAVDVYRGDFMVGFTLRDSPGFDEWQSLQTESLRRELADALGQLTQGYVTQEDSDRAIRYARRWVALDPLHEPAHRLLMRLYAGSDQRAAALHQYEACERVLKEEVGAVPEPETRTLYERILEGGEVHFPSRAPPHNLAAPLAPLIGREVELAQIHDRLRDPACRLLTLVGPGGSGKTHLALEAARNEVPNFRQGVFFVSLAPLPSVDAIVPTVAQALSLPLHAHADPQRQLLDHLRQKHMLLILDNFEHLPEGVGVVTGILRAAPQMKVVTTSRARLNARGEHLLSVVGLEVPPSETPAPLSQYSAVKLFLQSADRLQPGYEPASDELLHVAEVCRLVEGMPLAVLLAASWTRILNAAEIVEQITARSLDFLETEWREVPARQRSMRAVFEHSWGLLSEREQDTFAGLSVFRGGFLYEEAQQVTGASLRELRTLVDRSLLQRTSTGRYQVHELVRQYAAQQLGLSGVEDAVRNRHCAYYAEAFQRWEGELKGPRQREALIEMEADIDNARAGWEWAAQRGDVACLQQAMDGLCRFYERRGRFAEGETACRLAARNLKAMEEELAAEGLQVLVRAWGWQGAFTRIMGSAEMARELLEHGMALLDHPMLASQDTRPERAFILEQLGNMAYQSDNEEATRCWEESLALYRALGDRWATANVLRAFGDECLDVGEPEQGTQMHQESLTLRRALGDEAGIADSLLGLAFASRLRGRFEEDERLSREAMAICRQTGNPVGFWRARGVLSGSIFFQGRFAEAHELAEKVLALPEELRASMADLGGLGIGLAWVKVNLGLYAEARPLCHEALAYGRETGRHHTTGLSLWILGNIALAEGAYTEAQELLQGSVGELREIGVVYALGSPLAALGHVERRLGRRAQAQWCLVEGLRAFLRGQNLRGAVYCLSLAALLLADRGEIERGVELYALATRYPFMANSRHWENITGKELAALAATLSPEAVAAAQERGRARDLEATIEEFLAELEAALESG